MFIDFDCLLALSIKSTMKLVLSKKKNACLEAHESGQDQQRIVDGNQMAHLQNQVQTASFGLRSCRTLAPHVPLA